LDVPNVGVSEPENDIDCENLTESPKALETGNNDDRQNLLDSLKELEKGNSGDSVKKLEPENRRLPLKELEQDNSFVSLSVLVCRNCDDSECPIEGTKTHVRENEIVCPNPLDEEKWTDVGKEREAAKLSEWGKAEVTVKLFVAENSWVEPKDLLTGKDSERLNSMESRKRSVAECEFEAVNRAVSVKKGVALNHFVIVNMSVARS
jgi:hypothetical protein